MPDPNLLHLRLARLRSQHLTDDTRLDGDVAAVTRAVCALQAQAFDAARHQVRVRSAGVTSGAVDRAFEIDRSVVRMRPDYSKRLLRTARSPENAPNSGKKDRHHVRNDRAAIHFKFTLDRGKTGRGGCTLCFELSEVVHLEA